MSDPTEMLIAEIKKQQIRAIAAETKLQKLEGRVRRDELALRIMPEDKADPKQMYYMLLDGLNKIIKGGE